VSGIPEELIEQVRDSADLVAIVSESVELKRTGSDYRGACPFHGGTHRNFAVVPKKGLFYCYVCHEAGDVFTYFMKRFGMDYPTAVREVGRRVGITIPERSARQGPDPNEPLYSAVGVAQDWFARQLQESQDAAVAREYLSGRGITIDVAGELGLGFSPRGGEFQKAMADLGLKEDVLVTAGLLVRREDGTIAPRFRGRLLFPIQDLAGRMVAFGGRLLGPGEPKYLNSPETPIFHKGRSLYHLHLAKQAIRLEESAILVEGYFDVLRLALAGIENVVAPLGTALTPDQAALLKRFTKTVILLYDSDGPGLRATFRAGDELLRHDIRVRVATMPPGEDPDSLVEGGGADALKPILKQAVDVLERKIQLLELKGWFEGVEHRRNALDRLLPTIRAASNAITRDLYLGRVAERAGVSREVLAAEVAALPPMVSAPAPRPAAPPAAPGRSPARVGAAAELELLRVLVSHEPYRERARSEVRTEWFEDASNRELFEALVAAADSAPAGDVAAALSPRGQEMWVRLKERGESLTDALADDHYASACETLELRPLWRDYERMPPGTARMSRRQELQSRYPRAFQKTVQWQKQRKGTP
jgi:DNA primase